MKKLLVGVLVAVAMWVPVAARATAPIGLAIVTTGDPSTYDYTTVGPTDPLPWSFAWSNVPPSIADGCGAGCTQYPSPVALFTSAGTEYVVAQYPYSFDDAGNPLYAQSVVPVDAFGGEAAAVAGNSGPNVTGVGSGDAWSQYCCPSGSFPPGDQVTYGRGGVSVDGVGGPSGGGDLVASAFSSSGSTLADYVVKGVAVCVAVLLVGLGVSLLVRYLRRGVRAA